MPVFEQGGFKGNCICRRFKKRKHWQFGFEGKENRERERELNATVWPTTKAKFWNLTVLARFWTEIIVCVKVVEEFCKENLFYLI
jgi:hypothetical protein